MSPASELSVNYTREAFVHPINLGFLFLSALTAFFVNDIGNFANIIFTMAIGAELVYLGVVPRTEGFKRLTLARILRGRPRDTQEKEVFYNLSPAAQKKFLVLKSVADKIEQNFSKFPQSSQGFIGSVGAKIKGLLTHYIYMLDARERYDSYISTTRQEQLAAEIQSVQDELNQIQSEKLREIKTRRLQILQKRKSKLAAARERLQVCISQLETMEDAMRYIYEQSITMTNPEQIGFQLDHLLTDVEETVSIVEDLDDNILPGFNIIEKMDNFTDEPDADQQRAQRQRNKN